MLLLWVRLQGPEFRLEISLGPLDLGERGFSLPSGNWLPVGWMPCSLGQKAEFALIFVGWLGMVVEDTKVILPASAIL